jgi:hypothetical protein
LSGVEVEKDVVQEVVVEWINHETALGRGVQGLWLGTAAEWILGFLGDIFIAGTIVVGIIIRIVVRARPFGKGTLED